MRRAKDVVFANHAKSWVQFLILRRAKSQVSKLKLKYQLCSSAQDPKIKKKSYHLLTTSLNTNPSMGLQAVQPWAYYSTSQIHLQHLPCS